MFIPVIKRKPPHRHTLGAMVRLNLFIAGTKAWSKAIKTAIGSSPPSHWRNAFQRPLWVRSEQARL